jgi:hypothetical protein
MANLDTPTQSLKKQLCAKSKPDDPVFISMYDICAFDSLAFNVRVLTLRQLLRRVTRENGAQGRGRKVRNWWGF